ncbi:MAG: ABC transporter substrate-binding protein [Alcaligenaceae bacterium]|nr:ABC transporter substrate-binding protein [Alcaligenaceae bacterium]
MKNIHRTIQCGCLSILSAAILAVGTPVSAQVKVGVMQALSGPPAIIDFGESYLQGIKTALEDYEAAGGKTKIELVVYDDEANPQRAVSLAQRLIQSDRVPVVIGTVSSGNVLAMSPVFQKAKVPLMAGPAVVTNITSDFIDKKPSYIFRCSMVNKFEIEAVVDWATKNFKKIGLIHSTTGAGIFAAAEVEQGLKNRGASLTALEVAAPGVNDLTPQMVKMRDAGVELILNFHESYELPFRAMSRINYKPVVAGPWGLSSTKVPEIVGKDTIEGTVMGQALDISTPAAADFDKRMREEYGTAYRWPVVAALGYDAAQIVFKAVDEVGKSDPVAIRDAIENVDGIKAVSATPTKPFSANDHECLDQQDVFLGVWKGGEVVRLN